MARVKFYFDVGSPYAYLAGERLTSVIEEPAEWLPVSLGALFKLTGRSSWALGDHRRREAGMAEIERRAHGYGLPALNWPDPWPTHYLMAMRVAAFACARGREREFALSAFRDAFQRGRDLSVPAHVLDAAERAGLDPGEAQAAAEDPAIKEALRVATDAAYALGVIGVPTVVVDGEPHWGDDRLEDAAAKLRRQ